MSAVDLNEECLCFGWIDSRPARIDDRHSALLCTPRKPGSGWSKVNKDRLDRLLAAGLVAPAGLAAIERAKQDGSWNRLDNVDQLTVSDDLAAALADHPTARANFDAFPRSRAAASSSGSAPPRPRQRERSASRRQHSSHSTTSEPTNGPDNDHRPSRANTSPTVFGCIHPILTVSMPSPKLGWNCAPEGRNRRRNARGQPRATLSAGMCSRPHRAARSAELSTRCQRRADPRARTGAYGIDAFEARERA